MDLVTYEAAIQAIDNYVHIDEAAAGLDKIVAIEVYAKRANNHELERNAVRVRVRAERKCGELLKDREMNKGGGDQNSTGTLKVPVLSPKSLKEIGISKNNSSAWQRLADIPEEIFNKEINKEGAMPNMKRMFKAFVESTRPVEVAILKPLKRVICYIHSV